MADEEKKTEELSDLLKRTVNKFGELHLDAERTAMLIVWVRSYEETINKTNGLMYGLIESVKGMPHD